MTSDSPETTSGLPRIYPPASLTACAGTWLEHEPDTIERQRIDVASRRVREQRLVAIEFHTNPTEAKLFSFTLFREARFVPLHLSDTLIERVLRTVGEPPVVAVEDDPAFATYLRRAVLSIATAKVRSGLAGQLRRLLPVYIEEERWKEGIAIDSNAFRTSLGNEVSPFLVQMTLGGLARWYDQAEDQPEDQPQQVKNS
jgi:hypothetical protein